LDGSRAVYVVKGAIDFLRRLDKAPERPVAVIGFGIGGRVALASAAKGAQMQAVAMFYGQVDMEPQTLSALTIPLLGVFGSKDHVVPEADVRQFETAPKGGGEDAPIIEYPGVG